MIINLESYNINQFDISNLANNLILKKQQLGISGKELATKTGIPYSKITQILNMEPVQPNIATINKIAKFLNITVGDTLKYPNLPQYMPKFSDSEYSIISKYLSGDEILISKIEFNESYLNEKAFAVEFEVKILEKITNSSFIFIPSNEFIVGKYYLIKLIDNPDQEKYFFVEIIDASNEDIIAKPIPLANISESNSTVKFKSSQFEILGMAVKQKVNINLAN